MYKMFNFNPRSEMKIVKLVLLLLATNRTPAHFFYVSNAGQNPLSCKDVVQCPSAVSSITNCPCFPTAVQGRILYTDMLFQRNVSQFKQIL